MIGRKRAELGRQRRAAAVRQLVGVQLDRQPRRARRLEHPRDLLAGEGDALAKAVDRVDQPFGAQARES